MNCDCSFCAHNSPHTCSVPSRTARSSSHDDKYNTGRSNSPNDVHISHQRSLERLSKPQFGPAQRMNDKTGLAVCIGPSSFGRTAYHTAGGKGSSVFRRKSSGVARLTCTADTSAATAQNSAKARASLRQSFVDLPRSQSHRTLPDWRECPPSSPTETAPK